MPLDLASLGLIFPVQSMSIDLFLELESISRFNSSNSLCPVMIIQKFLV